MRDIRRMLGIHHRTLKRIVEKLGIEPYTYGKFNKTLLFTIEQVERIREEREKMARPRRTRRK